ncbi:MAG: alanyl-tRNA synthetase [Actinomycetota bacterium]|nr:alanyl-tRNA synthetase [Actinomycetota bacterium]
MDAQQLRKAFTEFFVERGHTPVPSAGLIPHHPAAPLLNNAGMNQFIPVMIGEVPPPYPRAVTVQKCFRTQDIEIIGDTTRHLTFFEMMGNFSFGDYFKETAIPLAWELVTKVLGLDAERLWITVHLDDDEAEAIWRDTVGVPPERIQRMGDDNFWEMAKGKPGPCGPCSEIYYDKGEEWGAPGGPLHGGPERYVEIWNLVFMQYRRQPDGSLVDLPTRNIDTGAGLERILPILQGVSSVFDTDVVRPVLDAAGRAIGRSYGSDPKVDRSLRILADHGRAMTMLTADGVFPSNEDRGYILRRIIRRAVRHAFGLGVETSVTPALVDATVDTLGVAYPELIEKRDFIVGVVGREEEAFRRTLRSGSTVIDNVLAKLEEAGEKVVPGAVAFQLHDTFGFPLELTLEVAGEHGFDVDVAGFDDEMSRQKAMGKAARKGPEGATDEDRRAAYRRLLDEGGPDQFTGYEETESQARIRAVLAAPGVEGTLEVFLDRTPFYAEAGGQVGDTGTLTTATGSLEVLDTTYALPGLRRHLARVVEGDVGPGQTATASVDGVRRDAIRRNHTGTHLLHWALREVLGEHVKQAGSLVAPDRLRFDFSHYAAVTPEELQRIEDLANQQVIENEEVRSTEMSQTEAAERGAIAFFGEKYGDVVRVIEAGHRSVELCGGTHVHALGTIGPIKILGESSIGANLRRIEAVTGRASLDRIRDEKATLGRAATLLRVAPPEVPERVEKLIEEQKALADQIRQLRKAGASGRAGELALGAVDGVVVARVDGTTRDDLRDLALAVRDQPGVRAVVLGGAPEGGGAALVAAVVKDAGLLASDLIADAARTVGGGGGKNPDIAVAGGRDPGRLDEALDQARTAAGVA